MAAPKPYKLTPAGYHGGYHVVDRESGRTVGTVDRKPDFDVVLWIARDADGRQIDGPCVYHRYRTRSDAAAAVWSSRDIDGLAAEDVLEDQDAGVELLDAALDGDDAALVAQFNDAGGAS